MHHFLPFRVEIPINLSYVSLKSLAAPILIAPQGYPLATQAHQVEASTPSVQPQRIQSFRSAHSVSYLLLWHTFKFSQYYEWSTHNPNVVVQGEKPGNWGFSLNTKRVCRGGGHRYRLFLDTSILAKEDVSEITPFNPPERNIIV